MYIHAIESENPGGLFAGAKGLLVGPYGGWGHYGTEGEIRPIGIVKAIHNADADDIIEYEDLTGIEVNHPTAKAWGF